MTDINTDQNANPNTESRPEQVTITAPSDNQNHIVAISQGTEVFADFDFGNVAVEKAGSNIIFRFAEGGSVTLENIDHLIDSDASPAIILRDGSALSLQQMLSSLSIDNTLKPAAGESGPASGGVSQYEDNPGTILDGVDKLDGLDFSLTRGIEPPDDQGRYENSGNLSRSVNAALDTPPSGIVINNTGDTTDNTPTITGTAEPGSTVIIEIGEVTMTTTADSSGNWEVTVSNTAPLSDGAYALTGTATDAAGTISTDHGNIAIDTMAFATITLDPNITADDTLTQDEVNGDIAITGTVGGDVQDGDTVTLTVNGSTYTGTVGNGTFSIDVPGSELAADPDQVIGASVSTMDQLGNTAFASDTQSYSINVNESPTATNDTNTGNEDNPITGNVLINDSAPDNDALSVTGFEIGNNSYTAGDTATITGVGTISIGNDGDYTFTPAPDWNGTVPAVSYSVSDGSQSTSAELNLTVNPVNDAPVVQDLSINISEEGLPGGVQDADGSVDTTNSSTISGTVSISDVDGDTMDSVTLSAPTTILSSGGQEISWTGDGTSTLIGSAGDTEVVSITIDETGAYTVELKAPIDHPGTGEDVQSFDIGVTASDGTAGAGSNFTIHIEDDLPTAANAINGISVPEINTNVIITLDVSGSMQAPSNVDGMSRLELANEAIGKLLDSYDDYGNVSVRIVTFSTGSTALGQTWVSIAEAKDLLDDLSAGGMTNYDAALDTVMLNAFESDGKIADAQNVSYFISDGQPNRPSGSRGIDPTTEEPVWTQFLEDNNINSYALGMGSGVPQWAMNPIAYDGILHENTNATMVDDLSQLSSVLLSTVAPPTMGELMTGDPLTTGSAIGADDGYLQSLTVDESDYNYDPITDTITVSGSGSSAYTFDSDTDVLTITTSNDGVLAVDMDTGSYTYKAPASLSDAITEEIGFTLRDTDNDTAGGSLTLNVSRDGATAANISGAQGTDVINGTSSDDVIDAFGGDDMVYGNAGNDILVGGEGDDLIIGGMDNDTMSGGSGGDTFAFSANAGEGNDTITDFDAATDVIHLTDVLDAQGDGDIDIADLLQDGGQNVAASVNGTDVELTISHGGETTVLTLAGINAAHTFDGDSTLSDLINHGLQIDPM